jgi:hypothetical protein
MGPCGTLSEAACFRAEQRQILTLGEKEIAALTDVAAALYAAKIPVSEMRDLVEKATKRRNQPKPVQDAACGA